MSKIVLIDADSLLYFEMGKDTLEEAIEGLHNRIEEILVQTGCEKYIGYLTRGKSFRYDIAKSNGMNIVVPSASDIAAFKAASGSVYDAYKEKAGALGSQLLEAASNY